MAVYYFQNFLSFIPQYIVSTAVAISVFLYLGRTFRQKQYIGQILRRNSKIGESEFKSPFYADRHVLHEKFKLSPPSGPGMSVLFGNRPPGFPDFVSLLYLYACGAFRPDLWKMSTHVSGNRDSIYSGAFTDIYRIFFSVIIWAGILFLITPYRDIHIFLPHLGATGDILVAVVLSVSIFEAVVSLIYFIFGTFRKMILAVEAGIAIIFTLSLLAPSMSWLGTYDLYGRILIYATLLALFLAIGIIMPQLRKKSTIYRTSFAFTIIAYLFIFSVILTNVLGVQ